MSGCVEQDTCGRQQPACSTASSRLSLADPSWPGHPHSASVLHLCCTWPGVPDPACNYRVQSSAAYHASVGCRCSVSQRQLPFVVSHAHLAHGCDQHRQSQPLPCMRPHNEQVVRQPSCSCWSAIGSRASPSRLKLRSIWLTFIMHLGMSLKHRHKCCPSSRSVTMEVASWLPTSICQMQLCSHPVNCSAHV